MKRILSILLAVLLMASFGLAVSAQGTDRLVWDYADLLTDTEEEKLQDQLSRINGAAAAVLTVSSVDGKSAESYANNFWDTHYLGDDGVLLLVCMDERLWWISTSGSYVARLDDGAIDDLADTFLPSLRQGEYYAAFSSFAQGCQQIPQRSRFDAAALLICFGIGLVIALIVVGVMAAQLKSVRPKNSAGSYAEEGSMHITESRDIFLYQNTTRRPKPQNNGSHSGGGGGGHSHGGRGGRF